MTIPTTFSTCRKYRYTLNREWSMDVYRRVMFLMLNPSTADETQDDPTIRRCIGYAKRWGFDGLYIGNAYAYRSTDPKALWDQADPIGCLNNYWLVQMAAECEFIVCAWGGNIESIRQLNIRLMLKGRDMRYLKLTRNGVPGHPLYLRGDLEPVPWQ